MVSDVAFEGLSTNVTLVQLLVLVKREDVTLKGVRPGISLVTKVALVLPGPNMHFHVRLEVATEIDNSSAKEERKCLSKFASYLDVNLRSQVGQ